MRLLDWNSPFGSAEEPLKPDGWTSKADDGQIPRDVLALVVQDAAHAHATDNLVLVQHNILAIQDATHAHAADNLVLTASAPGGGVAIKSRTLNLNTRMRL